MLAYNIVRNGVNARAEPQWNRFTLTTFFMPRRAIHKIRDTAVAACITQKEMMETNEKTEHK